MAVRVTIGGDVRHACPGLQSGSQALRLRGVPPLFAPKVVFVITRINLNFPSADFEDTRGQLVDEVAVGGTEDDGASVIGKRVEQHIFRAQVEVIRGFVEQQKVRWMQQQAEQGIAATLASGKAPGFLENIVFGKQETSEKTA